jgi:hypothetical protein
MARSEILYGWVQFVRQIVQYYFITSGRTFQEEKLFQYRFPEPLWDSIENFPVNLRKLPLWVNRELSATVFGDKPNYEFWQTIFETGRTPQGQNVIASGGINLMKMIQGQ